MSAERNAQATDPFRNAIRALISRATVRRANAVLWQFVGAAKNALSAEVFYGVGICALPAKGGKPEAIVVNVGGADAPVIIATRDEKTRASVVPSGIKAGETVIYSEGVIVYLRKDSVEIRTPSGTAKRLLTVDDATSLKQAIANAAVAAGDGGATFKTNIGNNLDSWPTGTTILKGQ